MRFFRIPSFTGVESHRDDADRGTLRIAEGCVPSGPGGLRSGPVWQDLGKVSIYSAGPDNALSGADDGKGNSLLFASRAEIIHDVKCFPSANTTMVSLGNTYPVATAALGVSIFATDNAYLSAIGNRSIGWGDGSDNALFGGKGPVNYADHEVYPDSDIYSMEYSWFPKCRFFLVGPNKCLFASGNSSNPLTVYISEPAGLTVPVRDSPYSTSDSKAGTNSGALSTVEILMSDANRITALSNRGNQVVVHTDVGAFLLYAPTPDQAEDGYRVAQAPSTVTSAGVNQSVTGGEDGTQPYYLGHDGQIYKDEASSRGSEETDRYSDPDQASWKAKGRWEDEHPEDLSNSFAAYEPEVGQYWVYLENEEHASFVGAGEPVAGLVVIAVTVTAGAEAAAAVIAAGGTPAEAAAAAGAAVTAAGGTPGEAGAAAAEAVTTAGGTLAEAIAAAGAAAGAAVDSAGGTMAQIGAAAGAAATAAGGTPADAGVAANMAVLNAGGSPEEAAAALMAAMAAAWAAMAPTAGQAPTGVSATELAPTAAQAPTGVSAAEQILVPTAAQAPTGVGALAQPTAAQAPTGVSATELAPTAGQAPTGVSATELTMAPTAGQAPTGISATELAPTAGQAPTGVSATELAPTAGQAPTGVSATELAPTAGQAPTGVSATELTIAPTAGQAPTGVSAIEAPPTAAQAPTGVSAVAYESGGRVFMMGDATYGQLILGSTTQYSTAQEVGVPPASGVIAGPCVRISCGGQVSIIVSENRGPTVGGGNASQGQLGNSLWPNPPNGPTVTHAANLGYNFVDASHSPGLAGHTLLLKYDGTLHGTGRSVDGALGQGQGAGLLTLLTVTSLGISNVAQIATGAKHSIILKTDGSLWVTGLNQYGGLGTGNTTQLYTFTQILSSGVAKIASGDYHNLFVKTNGELWGMGHNTYGQLGDGTTTHRNSPVLIDTNVADIAAGDGHSLFIKTDGSFWGMGYNDFGQLGDGTTTWRNLPEPLGVPVLSSGVAKVAAGKDHSLFIKTDGSLWTMGKNDYGQLGDGSTTTRAMPVQIDTNVVQISGGKHHSGYIKM
jgi:alpha-tubulin suppressor-like RCC1 family protein